MLEEVTKKKIYPTISLFSKLIRGCGRQSLSHKVMKIFNVMPKNFKQNNALYYNSFMNGLYDQDRSFLNSLMQITNNPQEVNKYMKKKTTIRAGYALTSREKEFPKNAFLTYMSSLIYYGYDYCHNCFISKKIKRKILFEEVLGGFLRKPTSSLAICNICMKPYQPL